MQSVGGSKFSSPLVSVYRRQQCHASPGLRATSKLNRPLAYTALADEFTAVYRTARLKSLFPYVVLRCWSDCDHSVLIRPLRTMRCDFTSNISAKSQRSATSN